MSATQAPPRPAPPPAEDPKPRTEKTARLARRAGLLETRIFVSVLVLAFGTLALRSGWVSISAWPILFFGGLAGLIVLWFLRRSGVADALSAIIAVAVPLLLLIAIGRSQNLSLTESVTNSFPTLLTSAYPATVSPGLLAPGLVITWSAGAVLGFGLTGRRFFSHPLVAAILLLLSADLLTAGSSDRFGLVSFGLVAVLLGHWSKLAQPTKPGLPTGAGPAAAIAALALAIGFIPLGTPFQPRDLIQPPVTDLDEPNPLPMLGRWAAHPDVEILRRAGDSVPLRLVVLPDYDGVSFVSRSEYVPVGSTDEPLLPPGRFQVTAHSAVTWQTTTRWLPAPGVPSQVSIPGALVDVDTGSLLTREIPANGLVSYTVTGRLDAAVPDDVGGAGVGTEPRYLDLPDVPPEFVGYAREVTLGSQSYLQMARALERAVKAGRIFDPNALGGSSYGRLNQFLFAPMEEGGRSGTSEQFATAYAVLARAVGMPARVVVGFGQGEELADDPGTFVVRGRDAMAWPEVYFLGYGWVPFNPTPNLEGIETPDPFRNAPPDPRTETSTTLPPPPIPPVPPTVATGGGGETIVALPWLILLLILAIILAMILARRRRAANQRANGPVGAWRRIEDAFVLGGVPRDRTQTAPARAAALGVPEAKDVAIAAETAAFALTPEPGEGHWDGAEKTYRELRGRAPWWRQAIWAISPAVWGLPPWVRRAGAGLRSGVRSGVRRAAEWIDPRSWFRRRTDAPASS